MVSQWERVSVEGSNIRNTHSPKRTSWENLLFLLLFLNTFIFNVFTSFNLLCRSEVLQAFLFSGRGRLDVFFFFSVALFSSQHVVLAPGGRPSPLLRHMYIVINVEQGRAEGERSASNIDTLNRFCASTPLFFLFSCCCCWVSLHPQMVFVSPCFNKQSRIQDIYFHITVFLLL